MWLWAAFVVFLRVGALAALVPAFGEQSVPARLKLAIAICLTLMVLPAVSITPQPAGLIPAASICGAEVLAGLFFGMLLRLFVLALQTAGSIAAQSASLSQLFGGSAGAEPQPAIGHLLVIGGLALATLSGLHVQVLAFLIQGYTLIPPGTLPTPGTILAAGLAEITRSFGLAFTLAAPFVGAALLYNLVLGVINRAMPQLMVTFVGAPALTLGGLLLMAIAAPLMLSLWSSALAGFLAAPFPAIAMSGEGEDDGERSYDPTPKRLEEARKRGEVPSSADLTTAAAYGGFVLVAAALGAKALTGMGELLTGLLAGSDRTAETVFAGPATPVLAGVTAQAALLALPWIAGPAALALLTIIGQQAFIFAPEKLEPKLSRISPMATLAHKFGAAGLVEFGKSLLKLCLYSLLLGWMLSRKLPDLMETMQMEPALAGAAILRLALDLLLIVVAIALSLGAADLFWQHINFRRRNMMTRKEVMDEYKESEGDPMLKGQRRQRGISLAMNQMLAEVPKADVVIVNPTHYAIALSWDRASKGVPVCVAKGVDDIAARIREIAAENAIPIFSDPPTARALFAALDPGDEIRKEHFRAVAAAIRFADRIRKKAASR